MTKTIGQVVAECEALGMTAQQTLDYIADHTNSSVDKGEVVLFN